MGTGALFHLEALALNTLALPHTGAQPPLPIAIRVPTRMPTADSFVGMPFMRPTLRMHCPSTLQRHTITEDRQGRKVRRWGGAPQPLSGLSLAQLAYVCFCAYVRVHGCGGWCKLLCACACVHWALRAQPHRCRCAQVYAVHVSLQTCCPVLPPTSPWLPQKLHAPDLGRTPARPHLGPGSAISGHCG